MAQGLVEATLETLSHGRALRNINEAIEEALADVRMRPNILAKRKVAVSIEVKPYRDAESGMDMPKFEIKVGITTPKMPFSDDGLVREHDGQVMVSTAVQQELLQAPASPDNVTRLRSGQQEA